MLFFNSLLSLVSEVCEEKKYYFLGGHVNKEYECQLRI